MSAISWTGTPNRLRRRGGKREMGVIKTMESDPLKREMGVIKTVGCDSLPAIL